MTESKTQIQFAMDTPMASTWTPEILGVAMMATKLESTWIILDAIRSRNLIDAWDLVYSILATER